jgi:hypothetical protein
VGAAAAGVLDYEPGAVQDLVEREYFRTPRVAPIKLEAAKFGLMRPRSDVQAVPPCRFNATAGRFAGTQWIALANMHRDNAGTVRAGKRRREESEPGIHSPRMGRHKRRALDSRKRRLRLAIPTAGQHRPAVHRLADPKGYIAPSQEANSR